MQRSACFTHSGCSKMTLFVIIVVIGVSLLVTGWVAQRVRSWANSVCTAEGVEHKDRIGAHHWFPRTEVHVVPSVLVANDEDPLNPISERTAETERHIPRHSIRSVQFDLAGNPEVGEHALTSGDDYVPPHMYVITRNGSGYLCARGYWHRGFGSGSADNFLSARAVLHHAMVFMDARSAHDYARRARYHIPQWWEWAALGIIALGQAAHIVIGDRGLLP